MIKKLSLVASLALVLTAAPSFAALRIDFSDDELNQSPGFRLSSTAGGFDDRFDLGSNVPGAANGVDFLRVSAVDPVAGDVLGFIIRLPSLRVSLTPGEVYGDGLDVYQLSLFNPGDNLFAIYHSNDVGLTDPLVVGDFNLSPDALITIGTAGLVLSDVNFQDLTNLQLVNNGIGFDGSMFPTLVSLVAQALNNDADFAANIGSAGTDISAGILHGDTVEGSSNGNIYVPEPGTLALLAAGALLARFRRTR